MQYGVQAGIFRQIDVPFQQGGADHPEAEQVCDKLEIFGSTRREFRIRQIVGGEAPARRTPCRFIADRDEAFFPTGREYCRLGTHTVGVVAERLIEKGEGTKAAFDLVGEFRPVSRVEVELHGPPQGAGRVGVFAENGLAPDDDEIDLAGDFLTRSQDVFELGPVHVERTA